MDVDSFVRAFLAVVFTLVAIRYTALSFGRTARHGHPVVYPGPAGSRARLVRAVFNVFRLAIWAVCVARVAVPGVDGYLGVLAVPALVPLVGAGLMLVSLAAVEYLNAFMDRDWRSGVAPEGPDLLLTIGPYAHVRHPMFLAVGLGQLGFAFALPSLFSLVCLLVGVAMLVLQAGIEERALGARFGALHAGYRARVPALWPRWPAWAANPSAGPGLGQGR